MPAPAITLGHPVPAPLALALYERHGPAAFDALLAHAEAAAHGPARELAVVEVCADCGALAGVRAAPELPSHAGAVPRMRWDHCVPCLLAQQQDCTTVAFVRRFVEHQFAMRDALAREPR